MNAKNELPFAPTPSPPSPVVEHIPLAVGPSSILQVIERAALGPMTEPGVYFGMSGDAYRAAGAVSASMMRDIAVSPLTAWARHIDPLRGDETTSAQDVGTAYHKLILEGDEAFRAACAVLPENDGDYLDGVAELKARCAELGLKKTGTIQEMCARIVEKDPEAKLWPVVVKDFREEHAGKIFLKPSVYQEIAIPAKFIRAHPFAGKAFEGGCPEVAVFWNDPDGMPCKARIDYLKTKAVIDLKSFANVNDLPINKAVSRAIANESHHIQARHYLSAVEAAKNHVKAGRVFGAKELNPWLAAFAAHPEHAFIWVFIQKGSIPEIRVVEFRRSVAEGGSENAYWTDAERRIEDAKSLIKTCLKTYGADPWTAPEPMRALQDADLPLWMME